MTMINRDNLTESVTETLAACRALLDDATTSNPALAKDIRVAIDALSLIDSELQSSEGRPRGQRSAQFMRYVIDEDAQMVMDPELRDKIVKIEDVYARY
jgi:hypothetical protein